MTEASIVRDRDYTLIIDKSGSMAIADAAQGKTRWQAAQESSLALAKACEEIDPDGITIYLFAGPFRRYDKVTSQQVTQIYRTNEPTGRSNLAVVLQDALSSYFERKANGATKPNGETFLVVTDGESDDRKRVIQLLLEAANKVDRDEELGVSLIQVGQDPKAREFLQALDDDLQTAGAKFDIVDTKTMDEFEGMSLSDILLDAVLD